MEQSSQERTSGKLGAIWRRRKWWLITPLFLCSILSAVCAELWPAKYLAVCVLDIGATVGEKDVKPALETAAASYRQAIADNKREEIQLKMVDDKRMIRDLIEGTRERRVPGLVPEGVRLNDVEVEKLIEDIQKDIKVRLQGTDYIVISYLADNSTLASAVLSELVGRFRTERTGENRDRYDAISYSRDQNLKQVQKRMGDAEESLRRFREENVSKLLMKDPDYLAKSLEENKARVNEIEAELTAKKQKAQFLKERLEETPSTKEASATYQKSVMRQKLESQIADLQIAMLLMKDQFTDVHPRMMKIQEQINKLKEQSDKEVDEKTNVKVDSNETYEKLRNDQNDVKLEIQQLESEQKSKAALVKDLERDISTIPQLLSEERKKNMEIDGYKRAREKAVEAKEDADRRAALAEVDNIDAFRIAMPVRASSKPDVRNKLQAFGIGMLITCALSFCCIAMGLRRDQGTFLAVDDARDFLDIPSLGIVPVIPTRLDKWRKRTRAIFIAILAALYVAAAVTAIMLADRLQPLIVEKFNTLMQSAKSLF